MPANGPSSYLAISVAQILVEITIKEIARAIWVDAARRLMLKIP